MTELKGLKFEIEYNEGLFTTTKDISLYFSSVKPYDTADRIKGIIEAIKEELPKVMKKDGGWEVRVSMYGIDAYYKSVDGIRYIIDKFDSKVTYRKWVDTANIYDVDCEITYRKKSGDMDRPKLVKELIDKLQFEATAIVLDLGRVPYDLSI